MSDTQCKICKGAGEKLFLKGERCFTPKCSFDRKAQAPMQRRSGKRRRTITEYGTQLREKQKVKNVYRIREKQFAKYVKDSIGGGQMTSPTERLYENLEARLDSVVYRVGFAGSRYAARQMVSHGHITMNGRKVDIPSYRTKAGDVISVRDGSKSNALFSTLGDRLQKHKTPDWLRVDIKKLEGSISGKPSHENADMDFNLTSVIEFYSR